MVDRVAAAVKARKPGEWVRGRGWHEGKWDAPAPGAVRGFPTHQALCAVSPDNPVMLTRADGHAVLVEREGDGADAASRAETAAPAGGEIIRDDAGDPTGVFVDNAERLVEAPERTADETAPGPRAGDGRVPGQGRHQPDRRRRGHGRDRRSTGPPPPRESSARAST